MDTLEFKLIPVDKKPESDKKKKIKVDEDELKYMQKKFPDSLGADYIQDIYKRFGGKKKK